MQQIHSGFQHMWNLLETGIYGFLAELPFQMVSNVGAVMRDHISHVLPTWSILILFALFAISSVALFLCPHRLKHSSPLDMVEVDLRQLSHNARVVDTVDSYGCTALHTAVLRRDTIAIATLLRSGADAEIRNHEGWMPLHVAAVMGNREAAVLLLLHGVRVGARSGSVFQKTPLHYAVLLGHAGVAEVLLQYGADMEARDGLGMTAREKAKVADHTQVIRALFGLGTYDRDEIMPLAFEVGMEMEVARQGLNALLWAEARFCLLS